ncbi:hypothetical protein GTY65_16015 [Streptomyces sp. SID8379]|uniref:hypothetical protein n=1 Tax=unclassified Streptomyces TaxID=2593676 RepID=UPI00037A72E0|nr:MULTISPECIES: hypothetical protein [unclassified Streptomyces]MYW65551.1 hypothetical protein [Streptomyces sp. SID8379]
MRTGRPLIAAAFAVAVTGLAATPAGASQGGLEVFPATAAPGSTVTVDTTACGAHGMASGDAGAIGAGTFTLAPEEQAADAAGRFTVPASAQPGTYEIVARCSDGTRVTGDLIVSLAQPGAAGAQMPRGHVETGVGGALGPDPVQTAAGVAALAVAAAGGTWLLHRRARGDGI